MFELSETVKLSDYDYTLPEERIAKFPLEKRDHSRLLHFRDGIISHQHFYELPEFIPSSSMMVFNNTKVIPARMIFQRASGAKIELFLLKPLGPSTVINEVMQAKHSVSWECMIGNLKKWKDGEVLKGEINIGDESLIISAFLIDRGQKTVQFEWDTEHAFVDIVEATGEVPLPPYLNRKPTAEDKPRYQTVYSKKEGAVAAPTAGLHFTDEVLSALKGKGIQEEFLTLHVSAGTFQPIKVSNVKEHAMHSEQVVVDYRTIEALASHNQEIIAVGTTSMRSLESLYWYGVLLSENPSASFAIPKLFPYEYTGKPLTRQEAFTIILHYMDAFELEEITGTTEIFIFPSYQFKVCDGLVTNFHQPSSTLILLVAAFTNNQWRSIYTEALTKEYRFLSYGDSSLLWKV
ncbi:S-adenosylmethionine:tRNA ribosyltransferase-isomerase [Mongoliitalea daihaiensis]|uniref:S-adenosylmethionine:tRNA ribosyltransferase-isomerase n=1 Tax=Mongoliitalea daihaiensis TaxID=2782006 RepID=UPI001F3D7292|nr:S-adenosylmethionine:tRNA ribosyltransferase-isomerase [Mongoliitalea daihaiensis]UJP64059.1 S-adenosylmethionine:tRNA ribosyltransferase-isomerase [Mongoliitalea daihaiensis]